MEHRNQSILAVLLVALICSLGGCASQGVLRNPQPFDRVLPSTSPAVTVSPTPIPTPSPTGPIWDEGHRLALAAPSPAPGALELPIYGATGYTTVKLGLWAEKPSKPPQTPMPSPTPAPEPTPEPSVVPTLSPLPAETLPPPETGALPAESLSPVETVPPLETLPPVESAPQSASQQPQSAVMAAPLSAVSGPIPAALPEPTPAPTPTPDPFAGAMAVLPPGTAFTILEESGQWWRVKSAVGTGWVSHTYCMINLPDVVPSIVYDATNSYDARYTTSGRPLPGVTGEGLYTGKVYNPRFDQEQYLMPVLYAMAKRVCQAQQSALAQGNSLKLYEGYRPYTVQKKVLAGVSALAEQDPVVKEGISAEPWGIQWFISTGYSNHQRGYAIDVSLVKVSRASLTERSGHSYLVVEEYEEYEMPTPIHELSIAAATFTEPVPVYAQTAWKKATLAPGMNLPALGLQSYCTQAGLTPLASEWWHFNDVSAYQEIQGNLGTGSFEIKDCVSIAP